MKAAFILQGWHLRDETIANWLADYALIVCNPSLDPAEIREFTDARLLAYYHAHTIPAYGAGNVFYVGMREAMLRHAYAKDGGASVHHPGANGTELDLSFDAYEDYAAWIMENLSGWDGVYLDEAWDIPDQRWVERCGRGWMDTRVRWAALLEYFRYKLPGVTIVANIGPPNHHSNKPNHRLWDAITIEKNHIDGRPGAAARAFSGSRYPSLNVAWWTDLSLPGLVMPGEKLPQREDGA